MAVQLLENWLKKSRQRFKPLSWIESSICSRARISSYWWFIVEYYLFKSRWELPRRLLIVVSGGYQTGLIREFGCPSYGDAVDQIRSPNWDNDIGKDIPINEALIILKVWFNHQLRLSAVTSLFRPASQCKVRIQADSIYSYQWKIREWNRFYEALASAYMQVDFLPIYDSLTDLEGQTSISLYNGWSPSECSWLSSLSEVLKGVFSKKRLDFCIFVKIGYTLTSQKLISTSINRGIFATCVAT